eukprot:CAMPEP_0198240590 /NCGR_PEP_ID=MMETSP1446-20131203/5653_1 /TAXON_ID=1461542 ORGANISM="Unidentified sp, Strain CCMP2111" /NCGR_SAMPLE_ID=MMETSP1446 /ASSEMBLY_ACC=CAM_ASM_001112 /LENGTH=74 /DNA_ID=CAMNT_0043923331 /DNA_START=21 /DNA_END=245 /DNA_ORIENTATION=-
MAPTAATAALFGGTLGFLTQMYSNAVRKLPVLKNPWEHGVASILGAGFGVGVIHYEDKLKKYIEETTHARSSSR